MRMGVAFFLDSKAWNIFKRRDYYENEYKESFRPDSGRRPCCRFPALENSILEAKVWNRVPAGRSMIRSNSPFETTWLNPLKPAANNSAMEKADRTTEKHRRTCSLDETDFEKGNVFFHIENS